MYWDKDMECAPREKLEQIQLERLQKTVARVYERVPFYRKALDDKGVKPGDIRSLKDLKHLPFTLKTDLRDTYPFGMFAAPLSEIVRIHASSGTTGKSSVVGYTESDLKIWAELIARTLTSGGANRNSIIQNAYGYGLFTGGLGVHYGAERIGASVIPVSGGNSKRQVMLMQDFGSTVLTSTPSYATHLAEVIAEQGIDRRQLKLEVGFLGAEPWTDNMRRELEQRLGILALDIYGLSEVMGPGVSFECPAKNGLHINEDHFIAEIIDPDTGEPLPYGEKGELVFTTITKEGIPVIRYRTRDLSSLAIDTCDCGRTMVRMSRITGRTDDMLIIRGVNVFPSQIESILLESGETEPHYLIIADRTGSMDTLEVWVEVSERVFSDQVRQMESLERRLHKEIEGVLGISVKVRLVEPKTIERSEGKAKRVIDRRKNA